MISDQTEPDALVAHLQNQAERIETDFGDGVMVWHRWPSVHPDVSPKPPPIILFHGGFGSWTHWFKNIDGLRTKADVIAADLPGLGDSDDVANPHTPDKLADILVQGLDQILDANQAFHLVGFSFGGMLGSLVASLFGDQCLTFTSVGASGFGDLHYIVKGIELPSEDMSADEANDIIRNNLQILMFAHPATISNLSLHIHQTNLARGRIKSRRMSVTDRLLAELPDIKAKIGGIWGEFDATGGGIDAINKRADIFRNYQPEAPFDIIEGAGHWVMFEKPDLFNAALLRHLDNAE